MPWKESVIHVKLFLFKPQARWVKGGQAVFPLYIHAAVVGKQNGQNHELQIALPTAHNTLATRRASLYDQPFLGRDSTVR